MAELAIRGGTVATPDGARRADVGVRDGRIAAIGEVPEAAERLDATGLLVLPGAIDVHTHLRLPTEDYPERLFHDTVAAAFGGVTTVLSFAQQERGRSLLETLRLWQRDAASEAAVDYGFHLIVTDLSEQAAHDLPSVIEDGSPTFKAFMVYDELAVSDGDLFRLLGLTGRHGGMMMVHCENRTVLEARVAELVASGRVAPRYHAASRPPLVEAEATHRALCLARLADAPLYVVHMSCAEALAHLRAARAGGQNAHGETCPHYLTLDESRYEGADDDAARYVISPPLRGDSQRAALWAALADGTLEVVGSDHVPRRIAAEREAGLRSFVDIPNGAPGLETMPTLVYQGVADGRIPLERFIELTATAPSRLFGIPAKGSIEIGKDADLALWDPNAKRTLRQADLHHSADFTPYEGLEVTGVVRHTLVRGRFVVRDGRFVGARGEGQYLERRLEGGR